jgi:NTP pyrophosphatase (non-canonical NTP hydrolase)
MNKEIQTFIDIVISKYGTNHQVTVAIEELSELQKELCKFIRKSGNLSNIAEEIADVQLMLWQMQTVFDVRQEEVERRVKYKIDRTISEICSS